MKGKFTVVFTVFFIMILIAIVLSIQNTQEPVPVQAKTTMEDPVQKFRLEWRKAKADLDEMAVKYGDARALSPEYLEYQRIAMAAMSRLKYEEARLK